MLCNDDITHFSGFIYVLQAKCVFRPNAFGVYSQAKRVWPATHALISYFYMVIIHLYVVLTMLEDICYFRNDVQT